MGAISMAARNSCQLLKRAPIQLTWKAHAVQQLLLLVILVVSLRQLCVSAYADGVQIMQS